MIAYYCNVCGAYYQDEEEMAVSRLEKHKETCTADNPFMGDDTADKYVEVEQLFH